MKFFRFLLLVSVFFNVANTAHALTHNTLHLKQSSISETNHNHHGQKLSSVDCCCATTPMVILNTSVAENFMSFNVEYDIEIFKVLLISRVISIERPPRI